MEDNAPLTNDPQQIEEIIRRRIAAGVSRQEIIFELKCLGLTRVEANEQINRSADAARGIIVNGQPLGGPPRYAGQRNSYDGGETPFYRRPRTLISLGIALTILGLYGLNTFLSGPTDEDRIKDLNAAAAANERSDGETGKTSIYNLRTGDCLDASFGANDFDNIHNANRVACDSPEAAYQITSQKLLSDSESANYPGAAYFDSIAKNRCPRNSDSYLFPSTDSWELGDRVIACIGAP